MAKSLQQLKVERDILDAKIRKLEIANNFKNNNIYIGKIYKLSGSGKTWYVKILKLDDLGRCVGYPIYETGIGKYCLPVDCRNNKEAKPSTVLRWLKKKKLKILTESCVKIDNAIELVEGE